MTLNPIENVEAIRGLLATVVESSLFGGVRLVPGVEGEW